MPRLSAVAVAALLAHGVCPAPQECPTARKTPSGLGSTALLQTRAEVKAQPRREAPAVHNIVINCREDAQRLAHFARGMERAGLPFEVLPCVLASDAALGAFVREGLVGPGIRSVDLEANRGTLGCTLAHLKALETVAARNLTLANIFEDDEVVFGNYAEQRAAILQKLPAGLDLVNMNTLRPTGVPLPGLPVDVFRTGNETHMSGRAGENAWLSNFVVSAGGARRILDAMRGFDYADAAASTDRGRHSLQWLTGLDVYLYSRLRERGAGLRAYAVGANQVSRHCERTSTRKRHDASSSPAAPRRPGPGAADPDKCF